MKRIWVSIVPFLPCDCKFTEGIFDRIEVLLLRSVTRLS
jgi:hypothetical protein